MTKRENPYSAVRALIVKDDKLLVVGGDGDGDFSSILTRGEMVICWAGRKFL